MPHIGARVNIKTYLKIQQFCKENKMTITEFLKASITEKLIGDALDLDSDWKITAAHILGISIGQLTFALANSFTVVEVFARLNDKVKGLDMYPILTDTHVGVQCTKGTQSFTVTTEKEGSMLNMTKNLLRQIEENLVDDIDFDDFEEGDFDA